MDVTYATSLGYSPCYIDYSACSCKQYEGTHNVGSTIRTCSGTKSYRQYCTTILTGVAVPSEHAAALTDSTRTLAVEAALLADAAALVESSSERVLTVAAAITQQSCRRLAERTVLAVAATGPDHAAALADSTRILYSQWWQRHQNMQQHLQTVRGRSQWRHHRLKMQQHLLRGRC